MARAGDQGLRVVLTDAFGLRQSFSGGGVAFTTAALPKARTVTELGVGIRYRATETMEVTARYDLQLRKGLRDQTATVRLAWAF
mgnify:CR=1 FL=1